MTPTLRSVVADIYADGWESGHAYGRDEPTRALQDQDEIEIGTARVVAFVSAWLEQWNHVMVEDGPVLRDTLVDEWKRDMRHE